ncbi:MAG: AAA family ATPase [Hyphomonadaceae bacterium]
MLIAFAGLPGVGKTTIARALAARMPGSVYLRIDTIEQALIAGGVADVGRLGYIAAFASAGDNLRLGRTVIADCVNPLPVTREAWRRTAAKAGAALVEIEVICSDRAEHRRRIETRETDAPVTWAAVEARAYHPYTDATIRLDTAHMSADEAVEMIASRTQG